MSIIYLPHVPIIVTIPDTLNVVFSPNFSRAIIDGKPEMTADMRKTMTHVFTSRSLTPYSSPVSLAMLAKTIIHRELLIVKKVYYMSINQR